MRTVQYLGRLSALLAVASLLAGCSYIFPSHPSPVADHWGDSYENYVEQMTANAAAGQVGEPVGLDPQTGELIGASYYELQEAKSTDETMTTLIQIDAN